MTLPLHVPPVALPIVLPRVRDVVRHATPNLVEAKLVPLVLFVGFLEVIGTLAALLVALAWTLGALACRWGTGRRVPGLVVLSAVALVARTVAAVATGSMLVYFLQPTVSTVLVGGRPAIYVATARRVMRSMVSRLSAESASRTDWSV